MYQVSGSHEECSEVRQDMEASPSSCLMHAAESSTSRAIIGRHGEGYFREASALIASSRSSTCHSTALYLGQLNYSPEAIALQYCTRLECTYEIIHVHSPAVCEARHSHAAGP